MKRNFLLGVFVISVIYAGAMFIGHVSAQKETADAVKGNILASPENTTPQTLPFSQNWTTTTLITANDDWSGVAGIEGFLGQDVTVATGVDPQTLLTTSALPSDLDAIANSPNPDTLANGGVAEFDTIANPSIAFQGSGTADAPNLIFNLNTTGRTSITVAYNLRDIDGSTDNAIQPVALQYRVGNTGNFTNVPAGFVADASSGPSLATLVTPVSAVLGTDANNQPLVQVRVITSNAVGSDEWVGVDDINVTGTTGGTPTPTPTPAFRLFESRLNGASEVPANASTATGFGRVVLNTAETQITASFYYDNLSSGTTVGHIHGPAAVGANASPIFDMAPTPGQTSGNVVDRVFAVTPAQVADLRAGLWYFNVHTVNNGGGEIRGQILAPRSVVDISGDGRTDFVVVRAAGGPGSQYTWLTSLSGGNPNASRDWGVNGDLIIAGDYDGDRKDDVTVYRASEGKFYIILSGSLTLRIDELGQSGDNPKVVGDYDGDGKDDVAVYRSGAQSTWFYKTSPTALFTAVDWGQTGDVPATGDYDGDGKADFVVRRTEGANGRFWKRLSGGSFTTEVFGLANDSVVPGDYDGDGKTDLAVFRNTGGFYVWDFEPSGTAGSTVVSDTWGIPGDLTVQGDYDGDGKTDYAVWRPGTPATFYMMTVGTRLITTKEWGQAGDLPTARYNTF